MEEIWITVLCENTAGMGFLGEWGLSMLVEADGQRILFDTGMGVAIAHNASLLGVDFGKVDKIVLSHGHHDHTGGLEAVLRRMKKEVEVIAHPDIWTSKYSRRPGGAENYSGIPFRRELLENLGACFTESRRPVNITGRLMTTGEIPMTAPYEEIDGSLLVRKAGMMLPDELRDGLALVIDSAYGLIVILGCGHHGMINTLRHARELTGRELIYAVIGGTHLLNASGERLEKTVAGLKD
ncbi:MAG: MBL fold metallo-hydrolase, partial [Dehalococcoidales bacterium]|nr:MBL fold metallo-hydrolase [Dehalococcoidales bacterium]